MCANQPAASKATLASCMVRLASLTAPAQTALACRNRIRRTEKHMPDPLRTGVHTYLASCNRLRHHGGDGNRGVGHADPSTTERRAALRASLPAPPRILVAAPCSASLAHTWPLFPARRHQPHEHAASELGAQKNTCPIHSAQVFTPTWRHATDSDTMAVMVTEA